MDTFRRLKLKNYFWNLTISVILILAGIGILQSVMIGFLKEYNPESMIVYICGGITSGCILLFGLFGMIRAFTFEKRIFKSFTKDEVDSFYEEIENNIELSIPGQVVMTKSFLLMPLKTT